MAVLHKTHWPTVSSEEVAQLLHANPEHGLTQKEAEKRVAELGRNELPETPPPSFWSMLLDQFKEVLVLILIGAAIISGFLGEWSDAVVILLIVLLNAVLGVIQQSKAEKSLAALKKLTKPLAVVVRDGQPQRIPAAELVPGDLVLLEAGDFVPADLRLIETATLKIDEAMLTGESIPVEKKALTLNEKDLPLGDQKNMAFMGTVVTYGRGKGLVVATGLDTQMGRIAELIQTAPAEETPLQRRLEELGKWLGLAALVLVFLVFLVGILHGQPVFEMFMTAISLAVAAIPEGLPAIVTIVLALGMQRMIRRNAIIRRLPAVETLGTTTVICSDKTGTLTQNQMTVRRVYTAEGQEFYVSGQGYDPEGEFRPLVDDPVVNAPSPDAVDPATTSSSLLMLLAGMALASDARLEKTPQGYRIIGDPTEGALVVAAEKAKLSIDDLRQLYPRVAELPFDSERKRMTTFHQPTGWVQKGDLTGALQHLAQQAAVIESSPIVAFTKGAPDVLLARCTRILENGQVRPLDDATRAALLAVNARLASEALRVLALGYREWPSVPAELEPEKVENDLVFLGFVGMIDPPRPEAREAVAVSRRAGIRTIMITGDHKATALAIAKDLGIAQEGDEALTGQELETMSDEELAAVVEKVSVYARVSPEHKMRIIAALKTHNHVVAMTGDGVNDAPALKMADIGVAMGITGTEVAKEAADMVLTDDNFASIVSAVHEGRTIYANIQKSIHYLLSCNTGEIATIFLAIVLNLGRPLTAIQILWTNLVTDGLPALALGMEPPEPGVMERPPRHPKESIFAHGLWWTILLQGLVIGGLTLGGYAWALAESHSVATAQTIAFMILSFSQLFHAFNTRSRFESLATIGPFRNRHMVMAFVSSALLQLAVLYIPPLNPVFNVVPLTLNEWEIVFSLAFLPIPLVEMIKALERWWLKKA